MLNIFNKMKIAAKFISYIGTALVFLGGLLYPILNLWHKSSFRKLYNIPSYYTSFSREDFSIFVFSVVILIFSSTIIYLTYIEISQENKIKERIYSYIIIAVYLFVIFLFCIGGFIVGFKDNIFYFKNGNIPYLIILISTIILPLALIIMLNKISKNNKLGRIIILFFISISMLLSLFLLGKLVASIVNLQYKRVYEVVKIEDISNYGSNVDKNFVVLSHPTNDELLIAPYYIKTKNGVTLKQEINTSEYRIVNIEDCTIGIAYIGKNIKIVF